MVKMIKTLIVDDDFLVRMFLKQITDWEAAGFRLTEDACNGKEALSIIEREQPGLIITDLSMPVMDGIELIKAVRENTSEQCIVALSCHDEFEYVREAMKMGADEYLLKNLLDEAILLKTLESVRHKMEQSARKQHEKNELQRLAQKGSEVILQELILDLSQRRYSKEEQQALCAAAGIPHSFHRCAAVIASGEAAEWMIFRPVCEQYCRNKNAVCLGTYGNGALILMDLSEVHSHAEQWEAVCAFAEGVKGCIVNYLNTPAVVGVSGLNGGDGGIFHSITQALLAYSFRIYDYRVFRYPEIIVGDQLPEQAELLKRVIESREEVKNERLLLLGKSAFAALRKSSVRPDIIREWYSCIMKNATEERKIPETLEKMEAAWMAESSCDRKGAMADRNCGNRAISQAVLYIKNHFHQPISLSQVAAEVHLNATYLSYLFKQETGVNFSEYLTECRMNKVKKLLVESDGAIKECAAAAGFQDYRNFCKLFKKELGLRPAEYRNQYRNLKK
ncbi:MAG: DNA-binding response regulator [Bacillota bacterium]|nr:DNA-binding response regulator [Bacillota bacterium]